MNQLTINCFPALGYAAQEAMNTLCTNLSFSGENMKRIMITSCHAAEGKSFISMNIMRTMAQLGKTVALVDADLRRSSIVSTYDLRFDRPERAMGLSHWLAGMTEEKSVVYSTNIDGAYMVPVGREVSNPLALLTSDRLETLLAYIRQKADYILVDVPPLGAVIDAAEISKACDGTLIVVKHHSVHRKELTQVKEQLEQIGSPILGTVLNRIPMDKYQGRKYYQKSYYYSGSYADGHHNTFGKTQG